MLTQNHLARVDQQLCHVCLTEIDKKASLRELSSIGASMTDMVEPPVSAIPWGSLKDIWMWCLGMWFSSGLRCVRLPAGPSDLQGLL